MTSRSKVIATSDQHIGYSKSNTADFMSFLDYVATRDDVGTLVLLGDFVDMWRRDAVGLFLENHAVLSKLLDLKTKENFKIAFVVGNHDYHLCRLRDHSYPFTFRKKDYRLSAGDGLSYRFRHGWEYDKAQNELVSEALCTGCTDDAGKTRSEIYDFFTSIGKRIAGILKPYKTNEAYLNHLMQPPEEKPEAYLNGIVRAAYKDLSEDEILVFGHTHRPFVRRDGRVANAGSWVSDSTLPNTFIELDGNRVRLFHFIDRQNVEEIRRVKRERS